MKHLSKRVLAVVGLGAVIAAGAVTANAVSATTGTDGFTQVTQTRVFDSGRIDGDALLASGHSQTVNPNAVTAGLVPAGATAVEIQITAASETEANGDLDVTPTTVDAPGTSNLNYTEGVAITSSTTATLGPDGTFSVYNHGGTAGDLRLIVDVLGYYAPTAIYTPPTTVTQSAALTDGVVGTANTGGSAVTGATDELDVALPAGTYQVAVDAKATPDANTAANVDPQFFVYDQVLTSSFTGDQFNVGSGALQNGTSHDAYFTGSGLVTVPSGGETLHVYAFGYDGDSGASTYTLDSLTLTAVPVAVTSN